MNSSGNINRVLFIIPSLRHGGAEIFLLRLASALDQNLDIRVVVIGAREGLAHDFEEHGIDVVYLELPNRYQFIRASNQLRKIIRIFQPDVIQSLLYYADFVALLSAFPFFITKLFWSFRGSSLPSGHSTLKRIALTLNVLASWLMPLRIIACSEQVLTFHKSLGFSQKKILIIPNFLTEWALHESFPSSTLLGQECPNFLRIGLAARFDPGKGHIELVRACVDVLRTESRIQGISLSFAGKGCESDGKLCTEINRLPQSFENLQFNFLGILQHDAMQAWYREIDLYVMPSDGLEGFPNSLSEAVALGVPAIATNCGSAVDFVGVDRIIDSPSAISIYDAIVRLLEEPLLQRISHAKDGMKHMHETYSAGAVLPQFLETWSSN